MTKPLKQHLIDPEICIRCYTCEAACPINAITHDDENVVVDYDKCNFCMDCISPCPTGSIDEWRLVAKPYSLEEQFGWQELPAQEEIALEADCADTAIEALDDHIAALLKEAHQGVGGRAKAPISASKPTINLYTITKPAEVRVQGNFRLTSGDTDADIRHIILDLGSLNFPVLEGQSIGITPPGLDAKGKPHRPRLYSVSSPRDGERPNTNNLSLTVKREEHGVCSNYLCDLQKDETINVTGPFGTTFLMPSDYCAKIIMICTGTGSAPFRGFTMHRQRMGSKEHEPMMLFFGARSPQSLPYFGPLEKIPETVLEKHFAFSRVSNQPKRYVQTLMREESTKIAKVLGNANTHIYICGLRAMEDGVERALGDIAASVKLEWAILRDEMRQSGRYHVETY